MNKQVKQQKINYFMEHIISLQNGMMDKIGAKTLLYVVKETLISEQPLETCPSYNSLEQYFGQEESSVINEQQASCTLGSVLANMLTMMNKGQEIDQIGRIISYYPYIVDNQSSREIHSQKRISYSA